ncbi:zinc finger protein 391 [Gouania willdenowi]|uniref:Zinc finger protein 391-like n=1 Tax=Gouania willdenowi TaxID=441366 RepID=A0A8C5I6R0_GOUWI|nr:zinc finger protein 391-like [Gouania willdenowi]XP_028327816.1 zinc finger protein 391-like [Gouania willdenowi]
MSWVRRYRDISPVTLQVVSGVVTSTLYSQEVEGLSAGLVESFLVEFYRCKLCEFTCSLKPSISSHLLHKHPPSSTLSFLEGADGGAAEEEAELEQGALPYQLDLNGESKQSDEDEDFLLYNMLDSMSPPTCDISSDVGLQVAHTCEVSTLFEEDDEEKNSTIFPLKDNSLDLSCSVEPLATQEEIAQSAHLMTLGLCRISTVKSAPPACSSLPRAPPINPRPPPESSHQDSVKDSDTDTRPMRTSNIRHQRPACLLCSLTLPSRRLLDVHIKSHRANGGFGCICCRWTAESWEELEPHWRSHCKKKKRRSLKKVKQVKTEKKKDVEEACQRTMWKSADQRTDGWRAAQAEHKRTECPNSRTIKRLTNSQMKIKTKRKENKEQKSKRSSPETRTQNVCVCSLCHRKFSSKLTLRRHLGIHGGEKPFSCSHCSYSSRLKASLLQHLRTHTGEKPYKCGECPYASIDRSSLLRHSRTHSKEKPYRCEQCDYSSIQKKSLDLHARRHHTGEAFPCQQCEYSSPDRQLLLRHVRRHHSTSQHAAL